MMGCAPADGVARLSAGYVLVNETGGAVDGFRAGQRG